MSEELKRICDLFTKYRVGITRGFDDFWWVFRDRRSKPGQFLLDGKWEDSPSPKQETRFPDFGSAMEAAIKACEVLP